LELIEDQEKGGKSVGNRVGATVGIQRGEHFKTFAIVNVALVLKEETEGPILDSKTKLAFTEVASFEVGHGHDQLAISMASGELWLPKIELDDAQQAMVGLCVLDGVKLKNLRHRK
jgi:hypothetical protein